MPRSPKGSDRVKRGTTGDTLPYNPLPDTINPVRVASWTARRSWQVGAEEGGAKGEKEVPSGLRKSRRSRLSGVGSARREEEGADGGKETHSGKESQRLGRLGGDGQSRHTRRV